MKELFLLRHSITEGIERKLYYGATDLPLTDAGRELCRSLRGSYDLPRDIAFATSGMLRAEETLRLLFGNVPHEILPELRESNLGVFEMRSYDDLKDDPLYQQWLSDETGQFPIPGGESNAAVAERVGACLRRLANAQTNHLLVVCHGGIIRYAMVNCFPDCGKTFYDWYATACHGYAIAFDEGIPVGYREI